MTLSRANQFIHPAFLNSFLQGVALLVLSAAIVLAIPLPCPAESGGRYAASGIVFEENHVTADIQRMPLKDILEIFREARGITYRGAPDLLNTRISKSIESTSIENALRRILFHVDHALIYDANAHITQIRVVNKKPETGQISKIPKNQGQRPHGPPPLPKDDDAILTPL